MLDWGDGVYELTAKELAPAAERAVEAAAVARGERVLDVGCGTGNAALAAARRGAVVVGIDPAERLLAVARGRAAEAGLSASFSVGDGAHVPAADASFDVVLSVFAVIFGQDAEAIAGELLRVVRPGGRIVITSWLPVGAIAEAGRILRDAMAALDPQAPARVAPAWGDEGFVRRLFEPRGARVAIEPADLSFTAASPAAWFEEQERNHPVWRFLHRQVAATRPEIWDDVRTRSIERLTAWNEDPAAFRAKSSYLVVHVTR
jgi:ubiquinone/menaquinone biosynthesis C-methylase UbiE